MDTGAHERITVAVNFRKRAKQVHGKQQLTRTTRVTMTLVKEVFIGIFLGDACRVGKPPTDESTIVCDQVQQGLHKKMTPG
jgi:hypothetical protein